MFKMRFSLLKIRWNSEEQFVELTRKLATEAHSWYYAVTFAGHYYALIFGSL